MTSNSDYTCEDSREAALWTGWYTFEEYLQNIEEYLKRATEEFEARVREQEKRLTPAQFDKFKADHVEDYVYYYKEFPKILRNSFFVSAYFLLEYDIKKICGMLKEAKQIPVSLSKLRGDVLERVKLYFKLAKTELSLDSQVWQEINNYSELRNCIVHNNGLLEGAKDDLINYVRRKDLVPRGTDEPEIALTAEFCKEAVDVMESFVDFVNDVYTTSLKT